MEYYDVRAIERDLRKVAPVRQGDLVQFATVCKRILGKAGRRAKRDVALFLLSLVLLAVAAVACMCGVATEGLWRFITVFTLVVSMLLAWIFALRFGKNEEVRTVARGERVARVKQGTDNFLRFFEEHGWGRDEMEALRFRANAISQRWEMATSGRTAAALSTIVACFLCVVPLCLDAVSSGANEKLVAGLLIVTAVAFAARGLYGMIEYLIPEFRYSPGTELLDLIYLCQMNGRFSFQARSACVCVAASSPEEMRVELLTAGGTEVRWAGNERGITKLMEPEYNDIAWWAIRFLDDSR